MRRLLLGISLMLVSRVALGQEQKGGALDKVGFRFELRERFEGRVNFDLNSSRSDDSFPVLQRLRLSLAPRFGKFQLTAQVQDSTVYNRNRSPYTTATLHLHQLHLDAPISRGFRVRAGRQEIAFGEDRLLGAFAWDNRGRVFDAVMLYRDRSDTSLRIFAANLTAPRRRNFPRGQNMFGASWKKTAPRRSVELYAFWLHDQTVARGEERAGRTRILTSGARLTQQTGGFKQVVEGAWQTGKRNRDSHLAGAFTWRGDYVWRARSSPGAGVEYNWASGDGNLRDGKSREFHNLFPTNHPYYGYMDLFGWRNLHNSRAVVSVEPAARTRVEASYQEFWLSQGAGAWRNAGGALLSRDPAGASGKRVGGEFDLLGSYAPAPQLRFLAGYSVFFPGRFARDTRGPDTAHFYYIQMLYLYR